MKAASSNRIHTRLKTRDGEIQVWFPLTAPFSARLLELSESGCRFSLVEDQTGNHVFKSIVQRILPETKGRMIIQTHSKLNTITLRGTVRRVQLLCDKVLEVAMSFNATKLQESSIRDGLLALAIQKISSAATSVRSQVLNKDSQQMKFSAEALRGRTLPEILISTGMISRENIAVAEKEGLQNRERLGRTLLRLGLISPTDLCHCLHIQTGIPIINISNDPVESIRHDFSYLTMLKYKFVPVRKTAEDIFIASAYPLSPDVLTELERICGKNIRQFLAPDDWVLELLSTMPDSKVSAHQGIDALSIRMPIRYRFCDRDGMALHSDWFDGWTRYMGPTRSVICGRGLRGATPSNARERDLRLSLVLRLHPDELRDEFRISDLRWDPESIGTMNQWQITLFGDSLGVPENVALKRILIRAGLWALRDRNGYK